MLSHQNGNSSDTEISPLRKGSTQEICVVNYGRHGCVKGLGLTIDLLAWQNSVKIAAYDTQQRPAAPEDVRAWITASRAFVVHWRLWRPTTKVGAFHPPTPQCLTPHTHARVRACVRACMRACAHGKDDGGSLSSMPCNTQLAVASPPDAT